MTPRDALTPNYSLNLTLKSNLPQFSFRARLPGASAGPYRELTCTRCGTMALTFHSSCHGISWYFGNHKPHTELCTVCKPNASGDSLKATPVMERVLWAQLRARLHQICRVNYCTTSVKPRAPGLGSAVLVSEPFLGQSPWGADEEQRMC